MNRRGPMPPDDEPETEVEPMTDAEVIAEMRADKDYDWSRWADALSANAKRRAEKRREWVAKLRSIAPGLQGRGSFWDGTDAKPYSRVLTDIANEIERVNDE